MIRAAIFGLLLMSSPLQAAEEWFTLASTTSTQNSGLFDHILPIFTEQTGVTVRVVAVGTGQAIRIARNGDADALLVHHRPSEDSFVTDGFGIERRDVMYNDFVVVGPQDDPANVVTAESAARAFATIAQTGVKFASRGDDSGTHRKEQELWLAANIMPSGVNYAETGSGMGATLNFSASTNAYTLTDRGTWLTFGNKGDLALLFSGDPDLFNPYGIILVNPEKFPHVRTQAARVFADWLVSPAGQDAIGGFQIDGFQAFCPIVDLKDGENTACPSIEAR